MTTKRREHIERYVESLRPFLSRVGLKDIEHRHDEGELRLTPVPHSSLPVEFVVVPFSENERCFGSNDLVCVSYSKPAGEPQPPRRDLSFIANALLKLATPALVEALGERRRRDPRLWNLDLVTLLNRGLKPAAIINVENRGEILNRVISKVPAAVVSKRPFYRSNLDHLIFVDEDYDERTAGDSTVEEGRKKARVLERLVYCAQDLDSAERLRHLDSEIHAHGYARKPELVGKIGVALGYPECCVADYVADHRKRDEIEDVRWLRSFVESAERHRDQPGTSRHFRLFSSWTNWIVARIAHMPFFEHFPCSPWCPSTLRHNHRMVEALFSKEDVPWLLSLLSVSFFAWPDGELVPFRCGEPENEVIPIHDVGTAWREAVSPRYQPRLHDGEGLLPAAPHELTALRGSSRGWEVKAAGTWLPLGSDKSAPLVLPFG